jgi:hypothetical protein
MTITYYFIVRLFLFVQYLLNEYRCDSKLAGSVVIVSLFLSSLVRDDFF